MVTYGHSGTLSSLLTSRVFTSRAVSGTNLVVTWQSVTNKTYYLQRTLGLTPVAFLPLATNLPGLTGTTSYSDTNAPAPGPWFYRVGVQ